MALGFRVELVFNLTFLERTEPVAGYQLIPFRTISAVLKSGDAYAVVILQFITKTGVLDVDDMVLCVGGMVTFFYIYKRYREKLQKHLMRR